MSLGDGARFAGYTVVRRLGAGGMGEVYLAQHPRLPRREALKILRPDLTDGTFRERFIREADSIAALDHPHIVTVHDRGDNHGQLWIATQYVDGTDAAKLLAHYPAGIPADEVGPIVTAIAAALDHAHSRGLLHRDVKPANILLADPDPDGTRRIYLADFGIARPLDDPAGLTATNFTLGTLAYSAPEQLNGQALDGRADQYALAATAYHLLTGFTPFPATQPIAAISGHLTAPPPKISRTHPDLAAMDDVLAKALAKNPDDRYRRCQDFARAFTKAADAAGIISTTAPTQEASADPTPPPPEASRRYRPTNTSLAVVILVALLLSAALLWEPWSNSGRDTAAAPPPSSPAPIARNPDAATPPTAITESRQAPPPVASPAPPLRTATPTTDTANGFQYGQPLWPYHGNPAWSRTSDLAWAFDPSLSALKFTQEFLGFSTLDRVTTVDVQPREAFIGVGQADPNGQPRTAATIHLERPTTTAPWAVIGTKDTDLTLEIPAYGSALPPSCSQFAARPTCPIIEVGGILSGVDESLRIRALQLPLGGSRETSQLLGQFCCLMTGGHQDPWSVRLQFSQPPLPGPSSDPPWPVTIVVSTGGHYATVERFAVTAVTTRR